MTRGEPVIVPARVEPGAQPAARSGLRALVIGGPGEMALGRIPDPTRPGECKIRVIVAGICGTDLQLLEGYAEFTGVPGHEFVGVVEEAPAGDRRWVGRRVVGEISVGCGACDFCRRGIKEHCPERTVLGIRGRSGAFAEYLSLPAANLHEVPDELDEITATFIEPLAAACRILDQIDVQPGLRTAVLGDGRMGLLVAQVLRRAGADVTVIGRHQGKLDIAADLELGTMFARQAQELERAFDLVVEVTGRPEGLRRAVELVDARGTVVLKSTVHGGAPLPSADVVVKEVQIVGSRCGPFPPAIELLASGAINVGPIVSRVAALEDFELAFQAARRELKVLLEIPKIDS